MTEPDPTCTATYPDTLLREEPPTVPECLRRYYEQERDREIAKLRDLDRILG